MDVLLRDGLLSFSYENYWCSDVATGVIYFACAQKFSINCPAFIYPPNLRVIFVVNLVNVVTFMVRAVFSSFFDLL